MAQIPLKMYFLADFEHTTPLVWGTMRFPGAISSETNIANRMRKLLMKMFKRPIGYSRLIRWELSEKIYIQGMSYLRVSTASGNLVKCHAS